jgi:hypothetical protein
VTALGRVVLVLLIVGLVGLASWVVAHFGP